MNTRIAVVIATFNGIDFIEDQLESIRLQTLEPNEVIICDDASTDGTYEFICRYINLHHLSKWKVMKNSENIGWIRNFYKLFELTTSDIIFCADQDDIWFDNKIELMTNLIKSEPRIKVLGGNYIEVDVHGRKIKKKFKIAGILNKGKLKKIPWNGKFYLTHRPGCALCFRKELLVPLIKIKTAYYPHDQLLWNIACLVDGAFTIDQDVIFQRRHNESAMIKKKKLSDRMAEIENKLRIITILEKYICENMPKETKKIETIKKTKNFFELRIRFMNNQNLKSGFQLLKYISYYPSYRSYLADLKERFRNRNTSKLRRI